MDKELFKKKLMEEAIKKGIILSANFEITSICNFKCLHCYMGIDSQPKFMDFDFYYRKLTEFKENGGLYLTLTGGEALLHPDFDQFYITAKKMGFIISIFSNGFLIDKKLKLFKEYKPYEIDITLYGIDSATYEKNTGCKNGQKVLDNLKLLKESNIVFSLKACVTNYIKPLLNQMREIAKNYSVTFRYDPYIIGNIFENSEISEYRLTPEEIADLLCSDKKMVEVIRENLGKKFDNEDSLYHCNPSQNSIYIDVDGKMVICPFAKCSLNFDLTKGGFIEGVNYLRNLGCFKRLNDMKCRSCHLSSICKYCPERFLLETGNPYKPPEWMCQTAELLEEKCRIVER